MRPLESCFGRTNEGGEYPRSCGAQGDVELSALRAGKFQGRRSLVRLQSQAGRPKIDLRLGRDWHPEWMSG